MVPYRGRLTKARRLEREQQTKPENPRPASSKAQTASALTQIGLFGLAVYGVFLSDAGDRLFDLLQGDIRTAEKTLDAVNREKEQAQNQLNEQRKQLSLAGRATLESQLELIQQRTELDRATALANVTRSDLQLTNEKLVALDAALGVTRPALISQRCSGILRQLQPYSSLEMRYRLLPNYRWMSFRRSRSNRDFASWSDLGDAYSRWADDSSESDPSIKNTFGSIDQSVLAELRDQKYWSQFTGKREIEALGRLKIDQPRDFAPRDYSGVQDIRNTEDFIAGYLRLNETSEDIRILLNKETIENTDQTYANFKESLRIRLEPYINGYSSFVTEEESRSAKTDDEIARVVVKHLMYIRNARRARESLSKVCYNDDALGRFMIGLD